MATSHATAVFPGINLDAASVRAEIHEREPNEWGEGSDRIAATYAVAAMDDSTINALIHHTVGDAFWEAYDNARSDVIARIIDTYREEN